MSETKELTVREAGRRGGIATRDKHDHEHFVEIGRRGGQRVRELLRKWKEMERISDGNDGA